MLSVDSIPTYAQAIGTVVLLIASGAGVVGYFKANVSKSTIELYKEDNEALRARLTTLEKQGALDAIEIKALKTSQAYLTSVITQADAIAQLRNRTDAIADKVDAIAIKVGA